MPSYRFRLQSRLPQLMQARELAEIAAVELALGPFHDAPFRDGLVAYCLREGIEVLAHTPLGGTKTGATDHLPV